MIQEPVLPLLETQQLARMGAMGIIYEERRVKMWLLEFAHH